MPTPIPTPTVQSASLYFREGGSDNEYHAAIEPSGNGYIVTFAYGRRGSTLNTGVKTDSPVSLAEATKVFEKLVASKTAKGYRPSGSPAPVYQQNGTEGADTGIRCQILNPVEERELPRLLDDERHCIQEKFDGRRLLVRKIDLETASFVVTGHNTAKRSVTLGLYDGGKPVPAGNVTIPPNHAVPPEGTVVECRYLYTHRESGAIYQPVYLGSRHDIPEADCTTDQLKYKANGR